MNKHIRHKHTGFSRHAGFSILEVVIGIFIFVVGLLALSALQGALTRSMADAKARTAAVNIAELAIESQRGFTDLASDIADPPTFFAFNDIVPEDSYVPTKDGIPVALGGTPIPLTVNGVSYTVDMDVTDYYYQIDTDDFDTTVTSGAISPTYKQVVVTVTWDAAPEFRDFDDDPDNDIAAADLGSGSVVLTAAIPALVTSASALVADETTGGTAAPPISYTPGANPDIVSLSLGDNKFKESLLPEPDVMVDDELVETRFDVITYSQTDSGAEFLRREEFAAVSCDCVIKAADSTNPGHRPVIWAGDEYVRGQHVVKTWGEPVGSKQSPLCDSCCRDHHDGGTASDPADHADSAVNTFVPFNPSTASAPFTGDHKHYSRPVTGDPVEVTTAGSVYVEACRMVRVDGFFRVAQDFRREDLNVFPNDFLDTSAEVDIYSAYVTDAATKFAAATFAGYESDPPCIGPSPIVPSPCVATPSKQGPYPTLLAAGQFPSWTTLPFLEADSQQLRSRGVYIDYLTSDLRAVLANCDPDTETAEDDDCKSGDVELDRTGSVNPLEMIPFFDVQMTKLNRWNETPFPNVPVDTTNEPLADNNSHLRGEISKTADAGESTVVASGHRGNIGFTDTLAIDPTYSSQLTDSDIYVKVGDAAAPPPFVGITIAGNLSETVPGNPAIVVTGTGGALCGQTSAAYSCLVPTTGSPRIAVSGYGRKDINRWACSIILTIPKISEVTMGETAKAIFNPLGLPTGVTYDFVIQEGTACIAL